MKLLLSLLSFLVLSTAVAFGLDVSVPVAMVGTGSLMIIKTIVFEYAVYTVPGLAMEVLSDLTGVTKKAGIRIFKPISGIGFYKDGLLPGATTEQIKIELVNSRTGTTKSISPMCEIRHLAELCCSSEGQYRATAVESFGIIDITSNRNSYDMEEGDYFTIELADLVEGNKYSIYGIESPYKGGKLLKYEKHTIPAGEMQRNFGVKGALLVGLDMYHIDRVKVEGLGFSTELKSRELQMLALRDNDIVCEKTVGVRNAAGDGIETVSFPKMGYDNMFVIGVRDYNSVFDVKSLENIEIFVAGVQSCTNFIVFEQ